MKIALVLSNNFVIYTAAATMQAKRSYRKPTMSTFNPPTSASETDRNGRNGEALARELIELLGVEGARRMCREHCWDGLATAIDKVNAERAAA